MQGSHQIQLVAKQSHFCLMLLLCSACTADDAETIIIKLQTAVVESDTVLITSLHPYTVAAMASGLSRQQYSKMLEALRLLCHSGISVQWNSYEAGRSRLQGMCQVHPDPTVIVEVSKDGYRALNAALAFADLQPKKCQLFIGVLAHLIKSADEQQDIVPLAKQADSASSSCQGSVDNTNVSSSTASSGPRQLIHRATPGGAALRIRQVRHYLDLSLTVCGDCDQCTCATPAAH